MYDQTYRFSEVETQQCGGWDLSPTLSSHPEKNHRHCSFVLWQLDHVLTYFQVQEGMYTLG